MKQFDAIELINRYQLPSLRDMEEGDDVLEWVASYVGSEAFQNRIENFCDNHADKFLFLRVTQCSEEDLSSMEKSWHEVHQSFLTLCDSSIEEFLSGIGFTMERYRTRCQEETCLSESRQRHTRLSFLVQILHACLEYDQFLNVMRRVVDPNYDLKRELASAAEQILQEDSTSSRKDHASVFLEFYHANPSSDFADLEQMFSTFASFA
uniref:Cilia- and flagella-associated protein 36 n=1 Tax=Albugo laibachii Nc14 TaxID=890382 RepID=F0WCC5_9STRA|nr:conserved hypothetical protein [Albugo laibachii Nc14]|eukprot:CCA18840.1 conserved hypothetical protein [Albugo laibachii Nc14]